MPKPFTVISYDSLPSTMDEARHKYEGHAIKGTVICAKSQTQGRGRFTRIWESEEGNLFATLLWSCKSDHLGWYAMLTGFAIQEACLQYTDAQSTLKWPNDVLLEGKKVSGVLLEWLGQREEGIVDLSIGFGVNISSSPKDTRIPACALYEFTKTPPTVTEFLEVILDSFLRFEKAFLREGHAFLKEKFIQQNPLGTSLKITQGNEVIEGKFQDLSPEGHLILELKDGLLKAFASGDLIS